MLLGHIGSVIDVELPIRRNGRTSGIFNCCSDSESGRHGVPVVLFVSEMTAITFHVETQIYH